MLPFPQHWIYWLGPFMGSAMACGFYKLSKYIEVRPLSREPPSSLFCHADRQLKRSSLYLSCASTKASCPAKMTTALPGRLSSPSPSRKTATLLASWNKLRSRSSCPIRKQELRLLPTRACAPSSQSAREQPHDAVHRASSLFLCLSPLSSPLGLVISVDCFRIYLSL